MQVEDVAGEGLASRRPPQQQRHLAVGVGLLGEVVVDAQRVLAAVEEVLGHRGGRVGRQVLQRRRLRRGRGDDGRPLHGAGGAQSLDHGRHGRCLLADGDVEAVHVLAGLVDDRVDRDRRLAGLAVADDELPLAAADRDERVDGLDAGLERLLHRLALDDARRLELDRTELVALDRAAVVERVAERVDHAPEQRLADGDLNDLARAADGVALLDEDVLAEQHDADVVLLEVEGEADDVVGQLDHLERDARVEAVHARDPVADLEDGADLLDVHGPRELLDLLAQDLGDLVRSQLHLWGASSLLRSCACGVMRGRRPRPRARGSDRGAAPRCGAAPIRR